MKQHPTFPSGCLFDNSYLVTSATAVRNKLSVGTALKAFELYTEHKEKEEKEMTAETFTNVVCKGLRILEIWRKLMEKRHGSVASSSLALARLCEHLATMPGLQSIMACAATGSNLDGKNTEQQGIPDFFFCS